jgi:hypothetical protein
VRGSGAAKMVWLEQIKPMTSTACEIRMKQFYASQV